MNHSLLLNRHEQFSENSSEQAIWTQQLSKEEKSRHLNSTIAFSLILFSYAMYPIIGDIFSNEILDYNLLINKTLSFGLISFACPFLIMYLFYASIATLKYSIYKDFIRFEHGLFKQKRVDIPFHQISSIAIVSYDDTDLSTISFGTTPDFDVNMTDFDYSDSGIHTTFANVKNGQEVYDLLNHLQKSNSLH